MNKFIVLTNPRNGSTWLCDTLNHSPDTVCRDELLMNPLYSKPKGYEHSEDYKSELLNSEQWYYYKRRSGIQRFNPLLMTKYLDELLGREKYGGFKLMMKHVILSPTVLIFLLIERPKIIRLKRTNYLDIAISQATLMAREKIAQDKRTDQISIDMDVAWTIREIKKCMFWDRVSDVFCRVLPCEVLHVGYEKICGDPKEWDRITAFIRNSKTENEELKSNYSKINTASQKEIIKNYDDLKVSLTKNGFQSYLRA